MDIQLPIMDGYTATRRIKADPALKSIPIIAVTSYALSGEEKKAREAGGRPRGDPLKADSSMSGSGTKRTWHSRSAMSAFGGKADMTRTCPDVRF